MDKENSKKHLRLVKPEKAKGFLGKSGQEKTELGMQESLDSVDWQILTGPPDATVIIDEKAPLEVKLKILAAVKSYTLGIKSVDHTLKTHGRSWEEQLLGKE